MDLDDAQLPAVLLLDHTGKTGGGQIALLRVARSVQATRARLRALVFEEGPFVEALRAAKVETVVIRLESSVNTTSRDEVLSSPARLARSAVAMIGLVARLTRAIRGSGARLVVANTLKSALATSIAAPLAGRRWVWHLHDRLAPDYLPGVLVRALRALAVIGPVAIVVNSEATRDTLPLRAVAKSWLAYPGLPEDAFESAPAAEGGAVVGMIGRISPTKGQREFIEAAARVAVQHPSARFVVVGAALFGEDEYEREIRALPAELGIADRVEFTGWVDDPSARLRSLSLVVHASPVPEPFGQVVVEAMAAGIPVVAADAGGVREILDPGAPTQGAAVEPWRATETGILVRPGDSAALAEAIDRALRHPEEPAARARAAREDARARFALTETTDAVMDAWTAASGPRRDIRAAAARHGAGRVPA